MPDIYDPGKSILETYIASQRAMQEQERQKLNDETNRANIQSETDFRKKQADHLSRQFDDEHAKNLADLAAKKAELDAHEANLVVAHHNAKLAIIRGVHEGSIPVPAQQFQGNGDAPDPQFDPSANQLPPAQQNQMQNAPLTFDGQTIAGNEYTTPAQQVAQTAPIRQSVIEDKGATSKAETGGKIEAEKPLFEQQQILEQKKLESNERVANVRELTSKYTADTAAQSRLLAAQINASARRYAADHKSSAAEIDPGAIEDRANQLRYSEGPPQGANKTDLAAMAVNSKLGFKTVPPKTLENLKGMKPLEDFSDQMTQFANKFLGNNWYSGITNVAKLNSPITSDEKNEYNQLLLQSTNIAKSVEGATGRTLMRQIDLAKDFIGNKNIKQSQLLDNAKKLNELLVTAVEGQLGALSPAQRVDYLEHNGFNTIAAHAAAKYKLAGPKSSSINLLNHPDYEVVK